MRGIVSFDAQDKTTPGLARGGTVKAAVETLSGSDGAAARAQIEAAGRKLRGNSSVGETTVQFVEIGSDDLNALATSPDVVSVEPYVVPELLDERAAQIVAGNLNAAGTAPTGPGYLGFLSTQGFPTSLMNFTVDITDEGIDKGIVPPPAGSHPDFFVNGNPAAASRLDYAQENTAGDANARDCGGHGTNVASIATGYNSGSGPVVEDAQGFNYGLGIAPRARVGATKIFNCAGAFDVTTSFTALVSNAFTQGARVSNNSWGANVNGDYNADSREYDSLTRDARPALAGNQQMVEVFSAGNAGAGQTPSVPPEPPRT